MATSVPVLVLVIIAVGIGIFIYRKRYNKVNVTYPIKAKMKYLSFYFSFFVLMRTYSWKLPVWFGKRSVSNPSLEVERVLLIVVMLILRRVNTTVRF